MKKYIIIASSILICLACSHKVLANNKLIPFFTVDQGPLFSINPNPVTGSYFTVNIRFTDSQFPDAAILVNDVLGKIVYSYTIRKSDYSTGQIRIDLDDAKLDKGLYFVQIKSGSSTKTLKLAVR